MYLSHLLKEFYDYQQQQQVQLFIRKCLDLIIVLWTYKKGGFLRILLGTLRASLLGNLLKGKSTIRAGEDKIKADQNF